MSRLKYEKLNYLMRNWLSGVIVTSKWLKTKGYYKQQVKAYVDKGWLTRVDKGAYSRLKDQVTWQGALYALQSQLSLPVHLGGLSALQYYGIIHYAILNDHNPRFYLYNTTNDKIVLPVWFKKLFTNAHLEQKKIFNKPFGITTKEVDGIQLSVASPERAILEVLALVPNKVTLEYANELTEGLDRLRTKKIQTLLECCYSIKVKRLFLYLAERNSLNCFSTINLKRVTLGSGKRVIGQGGEYNKKWMLSLPKLDEVSIPGGKTNEK